MVPDQVFAVFTASCSSRRKNRAAGMAKCMNCAFPAREARDFTLAQRLWEAALHSKVLAITALLFSFAIGAQKIPLSKSKIMPMCSPISTGRKCPLVG